MTPAKMCLRGVLSNLGSTVEKREYRLTSKSRDLVGSRVPKRPTGRQAMTGAEGLGGAASMYFAQQASLSSPINLARSLSGGEGGFSGGEGTGQSTATISSAGQLLSAACNNCSRKARPSSSRSSRRSPTSSRPRRGGRARALWTVSLESGRPLPERDQHWRPLAAPVAAAVPGHHSRLLVERTAHSRPTGRWL